MTSDEMFNLKGLAIKGVILDTISSKLSSIVMRGFNKILDKQKQGINVCKEQQLMYTRIRQVYEACKNVQTLNPSAVDKMTKYILTGKEDEL